MDKFLIDDYKHSGKRKNNPDVGLVSSVTDQNDKKKKYNFDPYLDPQLNWSGKEEKNELDVDIVSLHVHERIDPKSLIENLINTNIEKPSKFNQIEINFFNNSEFQKPLSKALQFYEHEHDWSNRLIAGDSLLVMNSLIAKESMTGKIQTIFMDPPYGINYKSNFQPFTNNKNVKDKSDDSLPYEPETICAFRDTWNLGIHSYLTHLRERILLCHELLSDEGSFFLQISNENLHYCKQIIEEIFGKENEFGLISFTKTAGGLSSVNKLSSRLDYLIWFAKDIKKMKYHPLFERRSNDIESGFNKIELENGDQRSLTRDEQIGKKQIPKGRLYRDDSLTKPGPGSKYEIILDGKKYDSGGRWWGQPKEDIEQLIKIGRVRPVGNTLRFIKYLDDFPYKPIDNLWDGLQGASNPIYVVQTNEEIIKRCILMTSDAGEIILDPTCGSGTTSIVAERYGRKWITCDTSRVALNLARKRLMTETYDYYKLKNQDEGLAGGLVYKEVERLTPSIISKGHSGEKETIYLEPIKDKQKKRVTGPFTVEAVPSIRVKNFNHNDNFDQDQEIDDYINEIASTGILTIGGKKISLLNLEKTKGLSFIHARGQIKEEDLLKNVFISFGPNYAPMEQIQVEQAVFELRELKVENSILIFCAFHFDPEASKDIDNLSHEKITFLKSQMSVDLLTADLRKKRSSNQSFWLIGEPDIEIIKDGKFYSVQILGFDYYNPNKAQIESKGIEGIALWMLDTNYDDRSLCPDQFFFPIEDKQDWTKLQKSLKNEIDLEKIQFFQGSLSEKFQSGEHKRIAVKIVDNRGIESLVVKDLL